MKHVKRFLAFCIIAIASPSAYSGALDDEIDRLTSQFDRSNAANVRRLVEQLNWSGIQDQALFDLMEQKLLERYLDRDGDAIEYSSWLVKGLAVSGLAKYNSIMQEVADSDASGKLKKHTIKAIERLRSYIIWAPVIGEGLENAQSEAQLRHMRVSNLLTSGHSELIRAGGKIVYNQFPTNETLQDQVEATLLESHDKPADRVHVDAMAWLCKSLAQSGDLKYAATLDQIALGTPDKKLRKHAKKYANILQ